MSVRLGLQFPKQEINVLLNAGGVGDHIARLPAIRYIATHYPHVTMHLMVIPGLHDVFKRVLPDTVKLYSWPPVKGELPEGGLPERPGYYFQSKNSFHTTLGTHLVDHGFNILLDRDNFTMEEKSYPRLGDLSKERGRFTLPEKYVVLTPGFTSPVREMLPEIVNEVARGVKARGLEVVYLGTKKRNVDTDAFFNEEIDFSLGLDLREKTSILEACAIMEKATAVIGLDNGILHMAALTDVPIIAGYSSQLPELRMPIRHGELGWGVYPVIPDSCHGCEPLLRFLYTHDFRECYAKDKRCLKELSSNKYLDALDLVLTKGKT